MGLQPTRQYLYFGPFLIKKTAISLKTAQVDYLVQIWII